MNSLQNKKIFILAGESSGDYIGSCIMSGIKKINKDIIFEFILLEILSKMLRYYKKDNKKCTKITFRLFSKLPENYSKITLTFLQLSKLQKQKKLKNKK